MDVCAINTVNFMAHARTMFESYTKHNPEGRLFLLLLDDPNREVDTSKDNFTIVRPDELNVPRLHALTMLYDAYEFSMSLRPHFLRYLQEQYGSEKIAFLDSDLYITAPLTAAEKLLDTHSMLLTPSYFTPIPDDGFYPSDRDFLTAGIFNGGFFACRRCEETSNILAWMAERLEKYAYVRPEECMFGDQAWLDMLPALAPNAHVVRDKGYNVSHWNLHERMVTEKNGMRKAGDAPLVFYHFSGFDPEKDLTISRHQNRFALREHPALHTLFEEYRAKLLGNGYREIRPLPYHYSRFENGVKISPVIRRIYEAQRNPERFGDPFKDGSGSFLEWLATPLTHLGKTLPLPNVHLEIWRLSAEAQARFRKPSTQDLGAYCRWICRERTRELDLDPFFTKGILNYVPGEDTTALSAWKLFLRRRHTFGPYQSLCNVARKVMGRKLYNRLKPRRDPMYAFKLRIGFAHGGEGTTEGLNVISSKHGRTGVAEAIRGYVRALENKGVPVSHVDSRGTPGRQTQEHSRMLDLPYDITLVGGGLHELESGLFSVAIPSSARKAMIAFMPWELQTFPLGWAKFLETHFDEVWAPSTFSAAAIARKVKIPILTMPLAIDVSMISQKKRTDFGLPEGVTIFLFLFDFHSQVDRKNPEGLIKTFVQSFGRNKNALLVLSAKNETEFPEEWKRLSSLLSGHENICILTEDFSRSDTLALLRSADCYVSLHRSEGFGLTIAESMALGVPVIATDYGGSTDFVTSETGYPVPWTPVALKKSAGPYAAGEIWAEPDTDAAARLMKYVAEHPQEAREKSTAGATVIQERFGNDVVGRLIEERLELLRS